MKKITLLIFGMVFLLAIVTAGVLNSWSSEIDLSKDVSDQIKESSNINSIDVEIEELECNDKECWANIYQKDVIQTEFRKKKEYCSELNFTNTINHTEISCLTYSDYTTEEMQDFISEFIEERLNEYGRAEIKRKSDRQTETTVSGKGGVTEK